MSEPVFWFGIYLNVGKKKLRQDWHPVLFCMYI